MILFATIAVVVGGMTVMLGGVLAIAGSQSRQEETAFTLTRR